MPTRVVLGWLRGEPDHYRTVAIPSIEEEDAKRTNRERDTLIREGTRLVNRMKACLARFGIRVFFVHVSALERAGLATLAKGQRIEYEVVTNRAKSSPENLKVV